MYIYVLNEFKDMLKSIHLKVYGTIFVNNKNHSHFEEEHKKMKLLTRNKNKFNLL